MMDQQNKGAITEVSKPDVRSAEEREVDVRLETALESVVSLARAMLAAGRFEAVSRTVAPMGMALARLKKQTAFDYLQRERQDPASAELANPVRVVGGDGGLYDNFGYGYGAGVGNNALQFPIPPAYTDQHQLVREAMLTVEKASAEAAAAKKPREDADIAASEANELVSLRDVLQALPDDAPERETLEARTKTLVASIGARATNPKPLAERNLTHVAAHAKAVQLVHPDVPRGHQAREDRQGDNAASRVRADADGGEGDARPSDESAPTDQLVG